MMFITVLYHRGLTHNSVKFSPAASWAVRHLGIWVTGLDPVAWACMHRRHHLYSDTENDPHSPANVGLLGVFWAQYVSYNKTAEALLRNDPEYADLVRDISYRVSPLKANGLWLAPYILHGLIGISLAIFFDGWLVGFFYWVGMLSHPIQGWMVNSLGHCFGYTNFSADDRSRNNTLVALTVMGEGFQNNHHMYPASAKFSYKWFEIDLGWLLCKALNAFGVVSINKNTLIPLPSKADTKTI